MKKQKKSHANKMPTQENNRSLELLMKQLQKMPILTKEEEVKLFRQISEARRDLIQTCIDHTESLQNLLVIKKFKPKKIRSIFKSSISEDAKEEEIIAEKNRFITLVEDKLEGKKSSGLVKALSQMELTKDALLGFLKPVREGSDAKAKNVISNAVFSLEKATNRLVECNMRLVFSRALKFTNRGLCLEDLIQEGSFGLLRTIDKFDYTRDIKFSTYAVWWIDQAFTRAIADKSRLIRVPVHMLEIVNKISRTQSEFYFQHGREATNEELAELCEISLAKLQQVQELPGIPSELDSPIGEDGDSLRDLIEDVDSMDAFEETSKKELKNLVRKALSEMEPRDEKILRMRFGIGVEKTSSLQELGDEFGVSTERIRQLEEQNIKRFRKKDHEYHSEIFAYVPSLYR